MTFSRELNEKMINYMKEIGYPNITSDQADEYLGSLAGLYLIFYEIEKEKK